MTLTRKTALETIQAIDALGDGAAYTGKSVRMLLFEYLSAGDLLFRLDASRDDFVNRRDVAKFLKEGGWR